LFHKLSVERNLKFQAPVPAIQNCLSSCSTSLSWTHFAFLPFQEQTMLFRVYLIYICNQVAMRFCWRLLDCRT